MDWKKKTELLEKLSSVLLPHNGQWSCLNSKWGFHGHKGKFMDGCKKFPFAWILVCILRISSYLNEPGKKSYTHTQINESIGVYYIYVRKRNKITGCSCNINFEGKIRIRNYWNAEMCLKTYIINCSSSFFTETSKLYSLVIVSIR